MFRWRGCQLLPPTHLCPTHQNNRRPLQAPVSGLLCFFHLVVILTCCVALLLTMHHIDKKRKRKRERKPCDCGAKDKDGNEIVHSSTRHGACLKGQKQKSKKGCPLLS